MSSWLCSSGGQPLSFCNCKYGQSWLPDEHNQLDILYVLDLVYKKIIYLQNKIISRDFCVMQHISYSQTVRLLWTVKAKGTKSAFGAKSFLWTPCVVIIGCIRIL